MDKLALGRLFSEHFGFPCQYHYINAANSLSSGAGAIGPFEATVPRDSVSPYSYK
jgi:hypothetical protein